MRQATLLPDYDAAMLRGIAALANYHSELDSLEEQLSAAPNWSPGGPLLAEIAWCRGKLNEMQVSWGRKLVVALVGPSGAGKSTLLNALAGRELSPTGLQRPTTRQVVVYSRSMADATDILEHCGQDQVKVQVDHEAPTLEYLVLVDTPDTNTLPENQRLLARVLERADLLLAIFPAQNPKMLDNIAFLRPYVAQLPPDAVVPVLNMVDRIPVAELNDLIVPDFRRAIASEWGAGDQPLFLISAKSSLRDATFPEDETPLHDTNEIDRLQHWLLSSLGKESQLTDRRVARAEHLLVMVEEHIATNLSQSAAARIAASGALKELARKSQRDLLAAVFAQIERSRTLDRQTVFYELMGQRWWGPVGWLVALWALLVKAGAAIGRWRRPRGTTPLGVGGPSGSGDDPRWDLVLERRYAQDWPPIAEALVRAGFDVKGRGSELWSDWAQNRGAALSVLWEQTYADSLVQLARILSAWPIQLLWNAPVLGMIGWVGFETVTSFFTRHYLPGEYFRHALIAAATIWLLSFVLLQVVVSLSLKGPLRRRVQRGLETTASEGMSVLQEQLGGLEALERVSST